MPWTPKEATKHNKKAVGAKGALWASVANSILKRSGDDAKAIRIANAAIKRVHK